MTGSILSDWADLYRAKELDGPQFGLITILFDHSKHIALGKDGYTPIYTSAKFDENNLEPLKTHVNVCISKLIEEDYEINGWQLTKPDKDRHPTIVVYKETKV